MIFSKVRPKPIQSLIPEGNDSDVGGSSRLNPLKAAASKITGLGGGGNRRSSSQAMLTNSIRPSLA